MTQKQTNKDRALTYVLTHLMINEDKTLIGRCNRCGDLVLKSDLHHYDTQCMACDEDLYKMEWHYVDIDTVDINEFKELIEDTQAELFL